MHMWTAVEHALHPIALDMCLCWPDTPYLHARCSYSFPAPRVGICAAETMLGFAKRTGGELRLKHSMWVTHRVTFRHSTVYSDMAAVVKEGSICRHLPAAHCASCRQEIAGHILSIQSCFKSMTLHSSRHRHYCTTEQDRAVQKA